MENVLKEAYQSVMEANKAKSVFLSNMSHDIRTPMNGIMGMTQIALQHLDDRDRIKDCLEKIDESSKMLLDLINEVLDMSYMESGKNSLHLERVELQQLIKDVMVISQPGIEMYRHTMLLDIDSLAGDYVMADAIRLRQVFTNILSNSIKYSHISICMHTCVRTACSGHMHIFTSKLVNCLIKIHFYSWCFRLNLPAGIFSSIISYDELYSSHGTPP